MSEMTYFGMTIILDTYLKEKYPGEEYTWVIGLVQKNVVAAVKSNYTTYAAKGVPLVWGHPAQHAYKLFIKNKHNEVIYESETVNSIRINAFDAKNCGRFLGTLKEVV